MQQGPQKITLAEMRFSGTRSLLIYCADYHCSHSVEISGDRWADDVRLSDLEPRVCLYRLRPARRLCPTELGPGQAVAGALMFFVRNHLYAPKLSGGPSSFAAQRRSR
jgi:hypothetical protein